MPETVTTAAAAHFGLIGPFHDKTLGRGERVITGYGLLETYVKARSSIVSFLSVVIAKNWERPRKEGERALVTEVTFNPPGR